MSCHGGGGLLKTLMEMTHIIASRVRMPGGTRDFSLPKIVHTGFGAHTASHSMSTLVLSREGGKQIFQAPFNGVH